MLVLGLLLILIALAALGIVIYDGAENVSVEAFGTTGDTTVMGVFFTGVGTTLLFFIGLWLLKSAQRPVPQAARRPQGPAHPPPRVGGQARAGAQRAARRERAAREGSGPSPGHRIRPGRSNRPADRQTRRGHQDRRRQQRPPRGSSAAPERQPACPGRHPARRSPSAGRPHSHGQARRVRGAPRHRPRYAGDDQTFRDHQHRS